MTIYKSDIKVFMFIFIHKMLIFLKYDLQLLVNLAREETCELEKF